jgi:hypothetical protein
MWFPVTTIWIMQRLFIFCIYDHLSCYKRHFPISGTILPGAEKTAFSFKNISVFGGYRGFWQNKQGYDQAVSGGSVWHFNLVHDGRKQVGPKSRKKNIRMWR